MGWERRKGKLYYYRKERTAGHVRSRYLGNGQQALEASRADGIPIPDELLSVAQPESSIADAIPVAQPSEADLEAVIGGFLARLDQMLDQISQRRAARSIPDQVY